MNISLTKFRKNLEYLGKTYIDFYNSTFSVAQVLFTYYIWGILFIHENTSMTILKYVAMKKSSDLD